MTIQTALLIKTGAALVLLQHLLHPDYVYPRLYNVETLAGLRRSLVPLAVANATLQANGTARMLAAASAAL
ncbi:putative PX protein [Hordeum vulgare]|nr:putative PX protein [Hordeum vulgare]